MAKQVYDVIVIGTGAGGGMAISALCKAGAKVCALNGSRRLDPHKDFRNHKQPYDMPFRGLGDPKKRKNYIGYMDNEYTEGIWEHEIAYTTAPGTVWTWRRCFAVGGKIERDLTVDQLRERLSAELRRHITPATLPTTIAGNTEEEAAFDSALPEPAPQRKSDAGSREPLA